MANDSKPDWHFETPAKDVPAAFPPDPVIEKAPVDDRGRVVRQDWSHDAPARNDPPFPDAPRQDAGKPTFTADNLSHLDSSGIESEVEEAAAASAPAGADPLAELDPDDVAGWRRQLKDGIRTPAELQRAYQLTDAELAAIQNPPRPPVTLARVARELAAIQRQMREDPRGYRKDGGAERHLELLRLQEKLKTEAPAAEAAKPEGLAEIEAELKKIADARRSDPRAYSAEVQERERELLQQRADISEDARQDTHLRSTVQIARNSTSDGEALEASFDKMFGSLGSEAQEAIRAALRSPAMESARLASEEQLETFRGHGDACAAVADGWGRSAARKYATAEHRFDAILKGMSDVEAAAAEKWFAGLPAAHKAAVIAALAG